MATKNTVDIAYISTSWYTGFQRHKTIQPDAIVPYSLPHDINTPEKALVYYWPYSGWRCMWEVFDIEGMGL